MRITFRNVGSDLWIMSYTTDLVRLAEWSMKAHLGFKYGGFIHIKISNEINY
jgi:hypothetical protein